MNTPSAVVLTPEQDTERLEAIEEQNYDDQVVKTATQNEDGTWCISADDGWTFGRFRVPEHMDPPLPGDNYRTYGKIGFDVIGGDLRGKPCWFVSQAERDAEREAYLVAAKAKKEAEYEASKDDLQAQYEALPETLRKRIDRFVANCPEDWWVEFGGYEMYALGVALKIAAAANSVPSDNPVEVVRYFAALPYEEQKELLPEAGLGHMSGSQFGYSCQIAGALVDDEHRIGADFMLEWGHGALTPLVGCVPYGCTQPSDEVIAEVEVKVALAKVEADAWAASTEATILAEANKDAVVDPIDVAGIPPAKVLAALYNASRPVGMGWKQAREGDLPLDEAESLLEIHAYKRDKNPNPYFDYLHGRFMKVFIPVLGETLLDPTLYDKSLGLGSAARALAPLLAEVES